MGSHEVVASSITIFLLEMLAAVELDDQSRFQAYEVADVGTERTLAAEAETVDSTAAEALPQETLSIGGIPAQAAGEGLGVGHARELIEYLWRY